MCFTFWAGNDSCWTTCEQSMLISKYSLLKMIMALLSIASTSSMVDEDDLMSISTQGLVPKNVVPTSDDFLSQVTIPVVPSIQQNPGGFAAPVTDTQIVQAQQAAVPDNTKKATSWAVNV